MPNADAGLPQTICFGGSVQLTATGGTSYSWSPSTGLSSTTGNVVTASPSISTTYVITVTDLFGCSETASVAVTVLLNPTISVSPGSASICTGASVQLSACGAVNYTWCPGSGLSSTTGTTVFADPTVSTTYTVTGTNNLGCSSSTTVTVDVNAITATVITTPENCNQLNGTMTVTPAGTCNQGFTYTWNTIPVLQNQAVTNVSAGSYTVTVYCGACSVTAIAVVGMIQGPLVSIANITNPTCTFAYGSATAIVTGGTSPYTYIWSNGQNTAILTNVIAGDYFVTVNDANSCSDSKDAIISPATPPFAIISSTNSDCTLSNGSATVTVTQVATNLTYSWSTNPNQTTSSATGLSAGTYTVTVVDSLLYDHCKRFYSNQFRAVRKRILSQVLIR